MAFIVKVQTDVRDSGTEFGPFQKRDEAEKCVIAIAGRPDVKSAIIEEKANG